MNVADGRVVVLVGPGFAGDRRPRRARGDAMFMLRARLLRLFGFDINVDASWVLLALLVVWTLARGVFPATAPGLSEATYLWMGVIAAAGLFASIVYHEICHALVA